MQLFDGRQADRIVDLVFRDQPPAIRQSVVRLVQNHITDMGGETNFLGGLATLDSGDYVLAYILHYPGKVAILTGPKSLMEGESHQSQEARASCAKELCDVLCSAASSRWDLEMLQVSLPDGSAFEKDVIDSAGFLGLAELDQLVFEPSGSSSAFAEGQTQCDWKRFTQDQWDAYVDWLNATYRGTQDCPKLNSIRTTQSMMDAYWKTANATMARESVAGEVALPQWWATYDPELKSDSAAIRAAYLLTPVSEEVWELSYMGVAERYRNQGLGSETLRHALRQLDELKGRRLLTYVDIANSRASSMYLKHGFVKIDRWSTYYRLPNKGVRTL